MCCAFGGRQEQPSANVSPYGDASQGVTQGPTWICRKANFILFMGIEHIFFPSYNKFLFLCGQIVVQKVLSNVRMGVCVCVICYFFLADTSGFFS